MKAKKEKKDSKSRREFIKNGAIALASFTIIPHHLLGEGNRVAMPAGHLSVTGATTTAPRIFDPNVWHQRIKRIMQVNFNERDIDFDVEAWANYLDSCKAQATFLSVTTLEAFYPSKIEGHAPIAGLKRDIFGECAKACNKRGIRIMGRLSPFSTYTALADKHPEWFQRNRDGSLSAGDAGLASTCQFTSYYSEFIPAVINEVLANYTVDGMYTNGWPGTSARRCYCQACQKIGDPDSQAYKDAYLKRVVELWNLYSDILTKHRPDMLFSGNLGGGFSGGDLNLKELTADAAWFIADNQGRAGMGAPAWDASQQVRIAKALMGDRPVPNSTGAYQITGGGTYRNVTGNPIEVRQRLAQTTAAGGVLYYHWLGVQQGFVEDRRWQKLGSEFLSWQAANDKHFHNKRSITNVALVVAQRSNRLYTPPSGTTTLDSVQGMYKVLTESRIPFDVLLPEDLLLTAKLAPYSTLILSNMALMSDAEARQIQAFAARGGSILATFETGLYDENGKPRADFALADLFDMRKKSDRQGGDISAAGATAGGRGGQGGGGNLGPTFVQRIERPHPIVASFKDTNWIQGPNWHVPITAQGDPILTFIAPYPGSPTEHTYSPKPHTDESLAVAREKGDSRLVYLSGDVDAAYWRSSAGDLGDLLTNSLNWVVGPERPFKVTGPGLVEIYAWQTEPGYAVHLVNFSNPNFRSGPARDNYPVGPQKVRLVLMDSRPIKKASLLRAGKPLSVKQNGKVVEFTVPSLIEYEVAVLEV